MPHAAARRGGAARRVRLRRRSLALSFARAALLATLLHGAARADDPAPSSRAPIVQPIVQIISQEVGRDGRVHLQIDVVSPSGERFEVRTFVDGRPVKDATLSQARDIAVTDRYTLTVPVTGASPTISVVVETPSGRSAPIELRLRRDGRALAIEKRPALHVLAVGVGRYRNPDIARLRFPAKDAADLAAALAGQRPDQFRSVATRVLTEEGAARRAVLDGIAWIAERTAREDTAVVFLAGHGMNDPEGEYYFLPQDARGERETMISGDELQGALRNVAGKVILMLDTCHSGNVLGRRSFSRLINDLAAESRVVVIASSTGDQISRESVDWNNGAFTKALVEGLRGSADYVDDGAILVSELETWLSTRVSELTGGAQTPTLAKPNAAPDYVIAALPRTAALPSPRQTVRRRFFWAAGGIGLALGAVVLGLAIAQPWDQPAVIEPNFGNAAVK